VSRPQPHASMPPDLPGYRFVRHLGAGGNAQVYLYEQDLPRREVAVKVLNESALSEAARRRFTAEANVTAGLAHRHIVQVFDAKVTSDGRPYIVMPYYPRPNLLVRARRAHLPVAEVLRIGIQIGSAVETSHRHGVLHRDIKPQNILTDSYGEPALTDFGIATTKGGDGPEGLSVPWSPPEILYGTGTGDRYSDVYSLAATLWHVLAGRSPFEQPGGDNKPFALMSRIKSEPVPPTGRADVPDSLERLLRQAMAKDPATRPQTAMELIRGLQSVEQELRLPVTQPILPASPPATGQGEGRHGSARPAAWSVPETGDADDPTRARAPRHLDPWSPAPGAHERQTRAANPVRSSTWDMADIGSGGRARQFPPEAPEAATLARPRAAVPDGGAGTGAGDAGVRRRGMSGRLLALSGGGVLLVVVVAVAIFGRGHGGGSPATGPTTATQPGIEQDPLGLGPGKPAVTARGIGGQQVEFSWVYANSAPSDEFRVQVNGDSGKPARPEKPDLVLSAAQGQQVCIQVQVVAKDGVDSPESSVSCWPKP
jgi:serine/threonine protein kinase